MAVRGPSGDSGPHEAGSPMSSRRPFSLCKVEFPSPFTRWNSLPTQVFFAGTGLNALLLLEKNSDSDTKETYLFLKLL